MINIDKLKANHDFETERCFQIKRLVQGISGFKDIGENYRGSEVVEMRRIYFTLCRKYTDASLELMANVMRKGYNHASVLHHLKKFDDLYSTNGLKNPEIYEIANSKLEFLKNHYSDTWKAIKKLRESNDFNEDSKAIYLKNLKSLTNKSHSIILKQSTIIYKLRQELKKANYLITENLEHIILEN